MESPQHIPYGTNELAHENFTLKRLNRNAFNRINLLEAKINDLIHENQILMKRIYSKQQNEEHLESAYTDYFQPSYFAPHEFHSYSAPHRHGMAPKMPIYKEETYPNLFDSCPQLAKNQSGMSLVSVTTPDTSLPSDSLSNVDSPFNMDANEIGTSDFSVPNGSLSDSLFDSNDDFSFLGKRKFDVDDNLFSSLDFPINYEVPSKFPCFGAYEAESQQLSVPRFDDNLFFDAQEGGF